MWYDGNNNYTNELKVGDKVIKNEQTWEPNDFDDWGRGIGTGIVVKPPFELDNNEVKDYIGPDVIQDQYQATGFVIDFIISRCKVL